jgi:hypothetical protein
LLPSEIAQLKESGYDAEKIEQELQNAGRNGQAKEEFSKDLFARSKETRRKPDYPDLEPSDLPGIQTSGTPMSGQMRK